jgi:hypothetical protein
VEILGDVEEPYVDRRDRVTAGMSPHIFIETEVAAGGSSEDVDASDGGDGGTDPYITASGDVVDGDAAAAAVGVGDGGGDAEITGSSKDAGMGGRNEADIEGAAGDDGANREGGDHTRDAQDASVAGNYDTVNEERTAGEILMLRVVLLMLLTMLLSMLPTGLLLVVFNCLKWQPKQAMIMSNQ